MYKQSNLSNRKLLTSMTTLAMEPLKRTPFSHENTMGRTKAGRKLVELSP